MLQKVLDILLWLLCFPLAFLLLRCCHWVFDYALVRFCMQRACRPNHGCSASGSDFFPIRDVAVVMRTWQPWIRPFEQISRWSRSYVLHLMILRMTYYLMMLLWLGTMVRTREALRTSLEAYRDKPDATPSWRPSSNKLGTCSYLRDEPCVFTAL